MRELYCACAINDTLQTPFNYLLAAKRTLKTEVSGFNSGLYDTTQHNHGSFQTLPPVLCP